MPNKYLEICSISLDVSEMQIKTTLRVHLAPEWLLSKNYYQNGLFIKE